MRGRTRLEVGEGRTSALLSKLLLTGAVHLRTTKGLVGSLAPLGALPLNDTLNKVHTGGVGVPDVRVEVDDSDTLTSHVVNPRLNAGQVGSHVDADGSGGSLLAVDHSRTAAVSAAGLALDGLASEKLLAQLKELVLAGSTLTHVLRVVGHGAGGSRCKKRRSSGKRERRESHRLSNAGEAAEGAGKRGHVSQPRGGTRPQIARNRTLRGFFK